MTPSGRGRRRVARSDSANDRVPADARCQREGRSRAATPSEATQAVTIERSSTHQVMNGDEIIFASEKRLFSAVRRMDQSDAGGGPPNLGTDTSSSCETGSVGQCVEDRKGLAPLP
jgi:hypothetical protein